MQRPDKKLASSAKAWMIAIFLLYFGQEDSYVNFQECFKNSKLERSYPLAKLRLSSTSMGARKTSYINYFPE